MATTTGERRIKLKGTALPAEHGGWGFVLEPVVLGLLAAGSAAALWLALMAFGVFLMRQPLKVILIDRRRGKRYARTRLAERFAALYAVFAGIGLLGALASAGTGFLAPLIFAIPLALVQIAHDARGESRAVLPELAGACAMGSVAAAMGLAAGWSLVSALGLWAIIAARAIPSILYVRARLPLEKGHPVSAVPALASHCVALIGLVALAALGVTPWLAAGAGAILLARAAYGLSRWRRPARAVVIGIGELVYGLLMAIMAAIGYGIGV